MLGRVDGVRQLLEQGTDPNIGRGGGNLSPVECASRHGHFEVATLRIAAGADIQHENDDGYTSLIIISRHGHLDVAKKSIHYILLVKGSS
jgi:ankyrin repeat protein